MGRWLINRTRHLPILLNRRRLLLVLRLIFVSVMMMTRKVEQVQVVVMLLLLFVATILRELVHIFNVSFRLVPIFIFG